MGERDRGGIHLGLDLDAQILGCNRLPADLAGDGIARLIDAHVRAIGLRHGLDIEHRRTEAVVDAHDKTDASRQLLGVLHHIVLDLLAIYFLGLLHIVEVGDAVGFRSLRDHPADLLERAALSVAVRAGGEQRVILVQPPIESCGDIDLHLAGLVYGPRVSTRSEVDIERRLMLGVVIRRAGDVSPRVRIVGIEVAVRVAGLAVRIIGPVCRESICS